MTESGAIVGVPAATDRNVRRPRARQALRAHLDRRSSPARTRRAAPASEVLPRERSSNRLMAHEAPPPPRDVGESVRARESVRGSGNLNSHPAKDAELRFLPRLPSAASTAEQGVEAVKGANTRPPRLPAWPSPRLCLLQLWKVTSSGRSNPEECGAPKIGTPLVHKLSLWTRTTVNPCKRTHQCTPLRGGLTAKHPANGPLLRREADRFTRERSAVRNHPCPSSKPPQSGGFL